MTCTFRLVKLHKRLDCLRRLEFAFSHSSYMDRGRATRRTMRIQTVLAANSLSSCNKRRHVITLIENHNLADILLLQIPDADCPRLFMLFENTGGLQGSDLGLRFMLLYVLKRIIHNISLQGKTRCSNSQGNSNNPVSTTWW